MTESLFEAINTKLVYFKKSHFLTTSVVGIRKKTSLTTLKFKKVSTEIFHEFQKAGLKLRQSFNVIRKVSNSRGGQKNLSVCACHLFLCQTNLLLLFGLVEFLKLIEFKVMNMSSVQTTKRLRKQKLSNLFQGLK